MAGPIIWGSGIGKCLSQTGTNGQAIFTDGFGNMSFQNVNVTTGFTSTATAAGTTTLTVSSTYQQYFTGTTTQTVVLPVVTTLVNGQGYKITNLSTGIVTVNTSGGNLLTTLPQNSSVNVVCINTAGGTGVASWDFTSNIRFVEEWYLSANQAVTSNVTPIKFDTNIVSTSGGWSATTGLYTAPQFGEYLFTTYAEPTAGGQSLLLYHNTTAKYYELSRSGSGWCNGAKSLFMNAGDTASIISDTTCTILGGNLTVSSRAAWLSIRKVN